MYNQPESTARREVPEGYGGNAFCERAQAAPSPACNTGDPQEMEAVPTQGQMHGALPLARLFSLFGGAKGGGHLSLRSIWDGDLLILALAVLLFITKDEECEAEDEHLWLLLLLVFFMK